MPATRFGSGVSSRRLKWLPISIQACTRQPIRSQAFPANPTSRSDPCRPQTPACRHHHAPSRGKTVPPPCIARVVPSNLRKTEGFRGQSLLVGPPRRRPLQRGFPWDSRWALDRCRPVRFLNSFKRLRPLRSSVSCRQVHEKIHRSASRRLDRRTRRHRTSTGKIRDHLQ